MISHVNDTSRDFSIKIQKLPLDKKKRWQCQFFFEFIRFLLGSIGEAFRHAHSVHVDIRREMLALPSPIEHHMLRSSEPK